MNATKELSAREDRPIPTDAESDSPTNLMESAAKLHRLPEGLEFPSRLRRRVRFDPPRGRLIFYGFMSKADFDRLRTLSLDASYQAAIDQLFRDSSSHVIALDVGIDQELERDHRQESVRVGMRRWALQWLLMIACFAGGVTLVWWWLSQLL